MRKTFTVILGILLFGICGCSREAPKGTSNATPAPGFLAATAEAVMPEKPAASEAAALGYLQAFNAKIEKTAIIPGADLTTVKFHTGMSHRAEGLVVNGSRGGDPAFPPDKPYYHEFHYDSEGKLSHIVENDKGVRTLSNLFYYDGTNPMARVCFVGGAFSYSDLAFYDGDKMYFKCRIGPDGKVISSGLINATPQ